jgi:hypothetical protein
MLFLALVLFFPAPIAGRLDPRPGSVLAGRYTVERIWPVIGLAVRLEEDNSNSPLNSSSSPSSTALS